jgi:Asp-tRNA(Asn)/Glu-tRNA(Gln) amidotransferase A subunit family amidase
MFRHNTIKEIHSKFADGSVDPLDLANSCITRINRLNPFYRAWVCIDPEALISNAKKTRELLSSNLPLKHLAGIPVGVKDVFNTTDFPTQMGSTIWKDFTPGNDARVVYYLKNAGGVVLGKTVTAEFAVHALNETLNPHNIELTPGTSSSGSAVSVALGMVPIAIGTQTGGSIIRPASFCGVYGFKPSFGLIPRTGSLKTTDSLDTIGFFVSQPADLKNTLEILRVHGPNFPFSYKALKDFKRQNKPLDRPWKIALVKTHTWQYASEEAQNALMNFAKEIDSRTGIDVNEVEAPQILERAHQVHQTIYEKSLAYYFKEEFKNSEEISSIMQEMIIAGDKISTIDYQNALNIQELIIYEMDKFFLDYDIMICLSTAGEAPPRNIIEKPDSALIWTLAHLPTISAPAFTTCTGEPFGLQIVARKYNDHLLTSFVEELVEFGLLPKNPTPFKDNSLNNFN